MVCQSFGLSQFREGHARSIKRGGACLIWTASPGMIVAIFAALARRCMVVPQAWQSAVRFPMVPMPGMNSTMPNAGGCGARHLKQ
jgi:hypothetical protein